MFNKQGIIGGGAWSDKNLARFMGCKNAFCY